MIIPPTHVRTLLVFTHMIFFQRRMFSQGFSIMYLHLTYDCGRAGQELGRKKTVEKEVGGRRELRACEYVKVREIVSKIKYKTIRWCGYKLSFDVMNHEYNSF